jgi:hypothetical protein
VNTVHHHHRFHLVKILRNLFFIFIVLVHGAALSDTDAEDALAAFIIMSGHGCPDVVSVTPTGNDTYRVVCRATAQYPGAYNNGTYSVSLAGGKVSVAKLL